MLALQGKFPILLDANVPPCRVLQRRHTTCNSKAPVYPEVRKERKEGGREEGTEKGRRGWRKFPKLK